MLEGMDQFLPIADRAVSKEALRQFRRQGLEIKLGARLTRTEITSNSVDLVFTDTEGEHELQVDKLVVAVGRRPFTEGLFAEGSSVSRDAGGFIEGDRQCRTTEGNVWAIGDVVRGPMLAHKGREEGMMVADLIAGRHAEVNYRLIPSVIYTAPEIAWIGQTEEQVKASGRAFKSGSFPFAASGRARAMEAAVGFTKIISATDTDEVLGIHIIGPLAGELVAEATLAMEYAASTEDIQRTVHAHPTLSEAIHEASLAVDKMAIDGLNR
jgi:dihydrolipoamide dehydrogenase